MPAPLRSINPWPEGVSPFSPQFRDIINSGLEEVARLSKLIIPIHRVISEGKHKEIPDLSTVVRGTIEAVSPDEFNANYDVKSADGTFTIKGATPINRWTGYAYLPASVDDECQLHIDVGAGTVLSIVVWETPDDKICDVPPGVPV